MKRWTAFACAAALLWGLGAVPSAADAAGTASENRGQEARSAPLARERSMETTETFELAIDPSAGDVSYSVGTPVLYAYGPQEAGCTPETGGRRAGIVLSLRGAGADGYRVTRVEVASHTPNVRARVDGGRKAPLLTLEAATDPGDCEMRDYEVVLSVAVGGTGVLNFANRAEMTVSIRGEDGVGYSRVRDLYDGARCAVGESEGCVFRTGGGAAAVDCGGGVSVAFHSGGDGACVNLLTSNETDLRLPQGARYVAFVGTPSFSGPVAVSIEGGADESVYLVRDGAFERVETVFENGTLTFETDTLGAYAVAGEEL